jgi:uncharacterized protein (DUF488 family)
VARTRLPKGALFTIGYEGRSVDDLVSSLRRNRVAILVDVRENAISRKAGFGKRQLAEAIERAGIEYRHEPLLGNPKANREGFRSGALAAAKRRYLKHLNNGSRSAFEELLELAMASRVALLCFERDEVQCHRACLVEQAQIEQPALSATRL